MINVDLSLVPVEELLMEVYKRYDSFVFSGIQFRENRKTITTRKWSGVPIIASGLASQLQVSIYDRSEEEAEEIGDEPYGE